MHNNNYNTHNRYRSRNRIQMRRFIFNLCFLITMFFLGLWLGKGGSSGRILILEAQIQEKTKEIEAIQENIIASRADAQIAETRFKQLQNDVLEEIPFDGPLRDLIDGLRSRIDEGVNIERLSFAIKAARPPQNCTDPEIKRFIVVTPSYNGPDSIVDIEDTLSISASGSVSKDNKGKAEAWYNPAKSVTVNFMPKQGEKKSKKATLPFSNTLIVGDKEYRFTMSEGARSFIKVTYDRCDYP